MKIKRLSVKLSLYLMGLMIPAVIMVSFYLVKAQTDMVEDMTLSEFKTAALVAAKAYGEALEKAIDMKEITFDEILHPQYEPITFSDDKGQLLTIEDPRYHTKLADVAGKYGIREIQNEIVKRGAIFASGITLAAYVPVPNDAQNNPPRGMATEADKMWDRKFSRQFRIYQEEEPRLAATFRGNPLKNQYTMVQDYTRDTGQKAWDVIAPIYIKTSHFGSFRIGVSRERLNQQYKTLILGLSLMFGMLIAGATVFTFFMSWYHLRPLKLLAARVDELSMTDDAEVLNTRIDSPDDTEIGAMAKSIERLRKSLEASMRRMPQNTDNYPTPSNAGISQSLGSSRSTTVGGGVT